MIFKFFYSKVNQGGGRKFLNRFIKIYLDELNNFDFVEVLHNINFFNN